MANKSVTVDRLIAERDALVENINSALNQFCRVTGVGIASIEIPISSNVNLMGDISTHVYPIKVTLMLPGGL